jgi:hypothetical protein
LYLKKYGSKICDLILGSADDRVQPMVDLEEDAE